MPDAPVGVLGARSLVGTALLPMLSQGGHSVIAVSRSGAGTCHVGVTWLGADAFERSQMPDIALWVSLLPIWVLPDYFDLLRRCGVKRLVALSSTSRFVKCEATDGRERKVAALLASGEKAAQDWARHNGVRLTIFRPTMIYGFGEDGNISSIVRFILRFGFFPLACGGRGLRQPVHARDVAQACWHALRVMPEDSGSYTLSGGTVMSYREMAVEIFRALDRPPRFVAVPLCGIRVVDLLVRLVPGVELSLVGPFERMGQNLAFDHGAAAREFSFQPAPFRLDAADLPLGGK